MKTIENTQIDPAFFQAKISLMNDNEMKFEFEFDSFNISSSLKHQQHPKIVKTTSRFEQTNTNCKAKILPNEPPFYD